MRSISITSDGNVHHNWPSFHCTIQESKRHSFYSGSPARPKAYGDKIQDTANPQVINGLLRKPEDFTGMLDGIAGLGHDEG
jgi:hypothetical protein